MLGEIVKSRIYELVYYGKIASPEFTSSYIMENFLSPKFTNS